MAAADRFSGHAAGLESPAGGAVAITPHDTNELANLARGIYCGVGGDVTVVMADSGTAVLFKNLAGGIIHPIRARIIKSTGTAATNIVAVY